MKPGEFVYKSVRDEAIKQGADLRIAEEEARQCHSLYRQNKFKKPADLMETHIKAAVRKTKEAENSTL